MHLSTPVLVDADAVRALIPSTFTVLEPAPGTAVVALVTQDCNTAVDEGPATRAITSVVFVFVNPALSPAGCETYDFVWTSSKNDSWHRALRQLGVATALVPQSTLAAKSTAAGMVEGVATNPNRLAPYSYTATAVDTIAPPGPLPSVHCHQGGRGLVRSSFDHDFRAGGGTAQVRLGRSDLWDRLGASSGPSGALLARFTWTGLTELVPQ